MPGASADHRRHRLERELEALLVDEPADQQHELLVRARRTRPAGARSSGSSCGRRSSGSIPFGITVDPLLVDAEDVGDLLAHVERAGDHPVGAVRDPALDAVDVGLRVLVDPALVAAVLGGVDRRHQRAAEAPRQVVAGHRDEPVVAVDEVEVEAVAELDAGREHVGVHPLDPGDELAEVGRALRLDHAVDLHAPRPSPPRATPRRRGSARGPRRRARPAPRRACGRGGPARPRSAAGTPTRGSGRVCEGIKVRAAGRDSDRAPGCAGAAAVGRRSVWPRAAPGRGR